MELEEKIWKEAEESLRREFESQIEHERETLQHKVGRSRERHSQLSVHINVSAVVSEDGLRLWMIDKATSCSPFLF